MTISRTRPAIASVMGGATCVLLAWLFITKREELLLAVHAGNILESNAISGVTADASYQVLARAQLLGLGLGALLFGWALLHARRARTVLGGVAAWVLARPYLVVLPMVALVFAGLIEARSIVVNGHAYLGLDDDAMISLRYADNLQSHHGLVYTPESGSRATPIPVGRVPRIARALAHLAGGAAAAKERDAPAVRGRAHPLLGGER